MSSIVDYGDSSSATRLQAFQAGSPAVVAKVRNILTFLQEMEDARELRDVPSWRVHPLSGDRKGTRSLTVTRNWRLAFRIDRTEGEILDLDDGDYQGRRSKP